MSEQGFEDIEQSEVLLKEWDSCYFQLRFTPDTFEIQRDYFYYASHFLNSNVFKLYAETELERQVWRLHSEGYSTRDIELIINATHEFPRKKIINKDSAASVINRLKAHLKDFMRDGDFEGGVMTQIVQLKLFAEG